MSEIPVPPQSIQDEHGNSIWDLSGFGVNYSVRFIQTKDGVKFSVIDVIKAVTGKDETEAQKFFEQFISTVTESIFEGIEWAKFKGKFDYTRVIPLKGVYKLVMYIPTKNTEYLRLNLIHCILELIDKPDSNPVLESIMQDCLQNFVHSSHINSILSGIEKR